MFNMHLTEVIVAQVYINLHEVLQKFQGRSNEILTGAAMPHPHTHQHSFLSSVSTKVRLTVPGLSFQVPFTLIWEDQTSDSK